MNTCTTNVRVHFPSGPESAFLWDGDAEFSCWVVLTFPGNCPTFCQSVCAVSQRSSFSEFWPALGGVVNFSGSRPVGMQEPKLWVSFAFSQGLVMQSRPSVPGGKTRLPVSAHFLSRLLALFLLGLRLFIYSKCLRPLSDALPGPAWPVACLSILGTGAPMEPPFSF